MHASPGVTIGRVVSCSLALPHMQFSLSPSTGHSRQILNEWHDHDRLSRDRLGQRRSGPVNWIGPSQASTTCDHAGPTSIFSLPLPSWKTAHVLFQPLLPLSAPDPLQSHPTSRRSSTVRSKISAILSVRSAKGTFCGEFEPTSSAHESNRSNASRFVYEIENSFFERDSYGHS